MDGAEWRSLVIVPSHGDKSQMVRFQERIGDNSSQPIQ